jgi:CHAT domain-containing protein
VLTLSGPGASEQKLNDLAQTGELGKFRYILLSTHCVADSERSMNSAVILSQDNLPDSAEPVPRNKPVFDGRLTAEEVLRDWKIDADLVTLSGCRSAIGKLEIGEGFIGFSQAFLLAGSRSVCVSLWKTDDGATALLMNRFHENLLGARADLKDRRPMPKADALAEAKKWLRSLPPSEALAAVASVIGGAARGQERPMRLAVPESPRATSSAPTDPPYAHPYYWAPFVLVGRPD